MKGFSSRLAERTPMNKMFTSIGVMQLVESGKLSLTDKLSDFIDESWLSKEISKKIQIQI